MEIKYLQSVDSTQVYLKNIVKEKKLQKNLCIFTNNQTNGQGSRGNSWSGVSGNLFFSFVMDKKDLPDDLEIQSASIYFSFILCEIFKKNKSKVWLKWPNDFYIDDRKIGGTITTFSNEKLICGIGINKTKVNEEYGFLDIEIDDYEILQQYFVQLEKKISWKQIFRWYKLEFQRSKELKTTINNQKVSLNDAILNSDGSITINEEKVYSLR